MPPGDIGGPGAPRATRTTCPYCGVGCGLILESKGERVTGLRPDPDHPVSRGTLCPKGATAHEFVHHPDRLTRPLIRRNGSLAPATWDEAYATAARELQRIRDAYGPDAVAMISSARATVEENYLAQKFARMVLGTNQVDNCFRICHSATVVGLTKSMGSGAMTNPISDFAQSRTLLVVGSNTPHAHPIIWRQWMKPAIQAGAQLILVDPRAPDLARLACLHLAIRPGTEVALFNAMAHHILAQGWEDRAFLEERCQGLEELRANVRDCTPEWAAQVCGVEAEAIRESARRYATQGPSSIAYGLGVTEHHTGVDNVRALANLALLTGNVGKPGTGINALRGQNNVQGATDMCRPETLPGYQSWADPAAVAKFESAWNTTLPRPDASDFLYCSRYWERILEGDIRALYVIGSDPALTEGNQTKVLQALKKLDLLIVQDVFPNQTLPWAHVVFPAASYAEKDGTYVNTERRVQRVRKAIEPVGQSRPDSMILVDLARAMGRELGSADPSATMDEIRRLVPSYAGISYAHLERAGGIAWPCPTEDHPGSPRLHETTFPLGRARLAVVRHRPPAEEPDASYPFLLTTGRGFLQYNDGSMTRRTRMEAGEPECIVQMSAEDARRRRLEAGQHVCVSTRRGSVTATLRIQPIRAGVIWMPFHYSEQPTNRLTNDAVDPECGITELKACAARVDPQNGEGPRTGPARSGPP